MILPIQDVDALKRVSQKTGESVSVLIRAAIRTYLSMPYEEVSVSQLAQIKKSTQAVHKSVRSSII